MSTVSSAVSTTSSRVSGLASGLDVDTIVSDMMIAESIPLNKLEQQKQILEWQQEDYRTLNTALYAFRETAFTTKLESTFSQKIAASSNSTVAGVTAGANSTDGTYTITVNQLATGVSKGSAAELADETDISGNTLTLYNQFTEFGIRGLSSTDSITVNINGTELEFDLDSDTINTVVSKISQANLGIKASYDSTLNRFFLNSTSTGINSEITISSDSANFFSNGTNESILDLNLDEGVSYNGQNASIDFGDVTGLEFAANSVTVNGINVNLKSEGSTTVTLTRDTDAIVASVKKFVDSYNENLSTLYSKLQEERDLDYKPLTDAQKEEMSDDEITKWEAKARSGLLRNDTLLQNLINNFRGAMSRVIDGIDGEFSSLNEIGITTQSFADNGKLYIDETALRAAIAEDPDGVQELFSNSSTTDDEKGIANKIYDLTANGIKYISDKAGSTSSLSAVDNSYIGKRLTEMAEAIEDWEERLEDIEDRYYTKFNAMETLINKMNIQSSWLTSQFASSSSS